MVGQPEFFDAVERLRWLSASGDPLERLRAVVDFEAFRAELEAALPRADRSRGGRPSWDVVLMFRVLVLQALYTLLDDQAKYQLSNRLSCMRLAGLALQDAVHNAKTIWLYREQLTRAGALATLFARFDAMLAERGSPDRILRRQRVQLTALDTDLGLRLLTTFVAELRRARAQDLPHHLPRHAKPAAHRLDRQTLYLMPPTDLPDRLHHQHPNHDPRHLREPT
jgi:hypothetical protein